MLLVTNIKIKYAYKDSDLRAALEKSLHTGKIKDFKIIKRSLDCRDTSDIHYVLSVQVELYDQGLEKKILGKGNHKNIMETKPKDYIFLNDKINCNSFKERLESEIINDEKYRPVIIGAGPAGYFAALKLSLAGFKPIVLERGKDVDKRSEDVNLFWENGILNKESNVSFGEGGAGTFSDGKLFTGNKDKQGMIKDILHIFHRFGAREEITYDAKPHIGTDILKDVMKNMRNEIIRKGGEVYFETLVNDISNEDGIYTISALNNDKKLVFKTRALILAIGHSARDTFKMLYSKGLSMEQKPFALGLRIEHKREMIDKDRYKESYVPGNYPAADYKLTYHADNGRAVFSFCMCPGGYVVNASSDEESMVVNGMSYSGRNGENSNSAIVVSVTPDDYPGNDPLSGVIFQQDLEKRFYKAGQGMIPVQRFEDFEDKRPSVQLGDIVPQIKGKYTLTDMSQLLPIYCYEAIVEGIHSFSRTIKDFDNKDAVLSGIESRTSSPVKILRDEKGQAVDFPGFFPCGEGAGYAGGITSAAQDGIKQAENLAYYLLDIMGI